MKWKKSPAGGNSPVRGGSWRKRVGIEPTLHTFRCGATDLKSVRDTSPGSLPFETHYRGSHSGGQRGPGPSSVNSRMGGKGNANQGRGSLERTRSRVRRSMLPPDRMRTTRFPRIRLRIFRAPAVAAAPAPSARLWVVLIRRRMAWRISSSSTSRMSSIRSFRMENV